MVSTKQQALQIAAQVRAELKRIYGKRLRGVYLFGSAARGRIDQDSDIDIAIVLDEIPDQFAEHERTSKLGSDISLQYDTLVSFLFVEDADLGKGRFAIHRAIQQEGIPA